MKFQSTYCVAVKVKNILAILGNIIETLPNIFSFTSPSCTPGVPIWGLPDTHGWICLITLGQLYLELGGASRTLRPGSIHLSNTQLPPTDRNMATSSSLLRPNGRSLHLIWNTFLSPIVKLNSSLSNITTMYFN